MRARFGGVRGVVSRVMSRIVVGIQLPEWGDTSNLLYTLLARFPEFLCL